MSEAYEKLELAIRECLNAFSGIKPSAPPPGRSKHTESDYLRLAAMLINRGEHCRGGLAEVIRSTHRPTTFYKRVAALRFYFVKIMEELADRMEVAANELAMIKLIDDLNKLRLQVQVLATVKQEGMSERRSKRKSKREAIKGLPPDWRYQLYSRGAKGKYGLALLVSALTGARPHELTAGVRIWMAHDARCNRPVICLHIRGTKVKAGQGQPNRYISYDLEDSSQLVTSLIKHLKAQPTGELVVKIEHAGNFSKEVQRLARNLWPKHAHTITAYCFRHQWSADLKAMGDPDAVSRGLGHQSAKTKRSYGTAKQSNQACRVCPVRIEADYPINALAAMAPSSRTESSTSLPQYN